MSEVFHLLHSDKCATQMFCFSQVELNWVLLCHLHIVKFCIQPVANTTQGYYLNYSWGKGVYKRLKGNGLCFLLPGKERGFFFPRDWFSLWIFISVPSLYFSLLIYICPWSLIWTKGPCVTLSPPSQETPASDWLPYLKMTCCPGNKVSMTGGSLKSEENHWHLFPLQCE
jgi:hypothetical protein